MATAPASTRTHTRLAMCASTGVEYITAHLPRERCLHFGEASCVLALELCNVALLTRNILGQHRAGATESQLAQILPEPVLLILHTPAPCTCRPPPRPLSSRAAAGLVAVRRLASPLAAAAVALALGVEPRPQAALGASAAELALAQGAWWQWRWR